MLSKSLVLFLSYLPTIQSPMGDKTYLFNSLLEISPIIFDKIQKIEDPKQNSKLLTKLNSGEIKQLKNLLIINSPKFGELIKFKVKPEINYLPYNTAAIIYDRQYDLVYLIKYIDINYQMYTVDIKDSQSVIRKNINVNAEKVLNEAFKNKTKTFINIDMNPNLPYEILEVFGSNTEALSW